MIRKSQEQLFKQNGHEIRSMMGVTSILFSRGSYVDQACVVVAEQVLSTLPSQLGELGSPETCDGLKSLRTVYVEFN